MNIFQMKTQPNGIERITEFISQGFVCIGYPGIENLEGVQKDEIRKRLHEKYKWTGSKLGNHLGIVNAFTNTMNDKDIVLITEGDWVHIGEVGPYYYDDNFEDEGMCHRRDVTWLKKIQRHQLNEYVKELLRNRSIVTKFKHPSDIAELDKVLNPEKDLSDKQHVFSFDEILVSEDHVKKALQVLLSALESENEEVRVDAAKSILKVSKLLG